MRTREVYPVRRFQSALANVKYLHGRPIPCTRENLALIAQGKL